MDALTDDDHSETIAERIARYWRNAEVAFDLASTAALHDLSHQHMQIAWMWAELAQELERKPVPIVRDGEGQRKRQ